MAAIRPLGDERGLSLVLALLVLSALSIAVLTVTQLSLASQSSARLTGDALKASVLADAGLNNALAVLGNATDPANPYLLPARTNAYEGGTVTWSGSLDAATSSWKITAVGTATAAGLTPRARTMTAVVPVVPTLSQPLTNPAWNYIYSTQVGSGCDMTIQQSVEVASPLYVTGNLCLQNTATVTKGPLQVHGQLAMYHSGNAVGSVGAPVSEAHVKGGCTWKSNPLHNPCSTADNVFAGVVDSAPASIAAPAADWTSWYLSGSPGPYRPCVIQSGAVPTFDNDQGSPNAPDASRRNTSVATIFNLTPATSYVCRTAVGELSWDAAARKLTVKGTVSIDGSATIDNGTVAAYQGQASLYLSGTLLIRNSKLCAVVKADGTGCDTAAWNPDTTMLVVAANGNGGQVPVGVGVQLVSSTFQGAVFATSAVSIDTTSKIIGPIVGSTVILGQSVTTSFPPVSIVPVATPGNPVAYSTIGTPQSYGG